jgi:uncharacterized coiled-coil protein SlyX
MESDAESAESRIIELEVKLAFHEHTIAQLDEELQKTIAWVAELDERLRQLRAEHESSQQPLDNPPPPHW